MVTDILSDISDIFSLQASSAYEVLSDEVERKAYAIGQVDHWSCCPAEFSCSRMRDAPFFWGGWNYVKFMIYYIYIYDIIWFSDKLWWEMRHEKKGHGANVPANWGQTACWGPWVAGRIFADGQVAAEAKTKVQALEMTWSFPLQCFQIDVFKDAQSLREASFFPPCFLNLGGWSKMTNTFQGSVEICWNHQPVVVLFHCMILRLWQILADFGRFWLYTVGPSSFLGTARHGTTSPQQLW